jgi:aryl sulfotransferase
VHYRDMAYDSRRWDGFAFRDDDIVISTPPKSGTTWTQMICALLVFGTPDFDRDLDQMSPWLDSVADPRDSVVAALEAQRHRRFIKSHTPLDGLPFDDRVTYVCVGRDPRDVGISLRNHLANVDPQAVRRIREAAHGPTAERLVRAGPLAEETSERDWFRYWIRNETPITDDFRSLRFTMHHLSTFWEARHSANLVFLHYDDLKADLPAEMRRLARRLDITVPESAWPSLVHAARFESMRQDTRLVPDARVGLWRENRRFFNRGVSGQWVGLLDEADQRDYAARVTELVAPDLVEWVHRAPITTACPATADSPPAGSPAS